MLDPVLVYRQFHRGIHVGLRFAPEAELYSSYSADEWRVLRSERLSRILQARYQQWSCQLKVILCRTLSFQTAQTGLVWIICAANNQWVR